MNTANSPKQTDITTKLVCHGCRRTYSPPDDAIVVSMATAIPLAKSTLSISGDPSSVPLFVVAEMKGVTPDRLPQVREATEASIKLLSGFVKSGQTVTWVCKECSHQNSLP